MTEETDFRENYSALRKNIRSLLIGINLIFVAFCFIVMVPVSVYIYFSSPENSKINLMVSMPLLLLSNVLCMTFFFTMLTLLMRKFAPLLGLKPNLRFEISEKIEPSGIDNEKDMEKFKFTNKILLYSTFVLFSIMAICALFAYNYFKYVALAMVFYYIAYSVFVLFIAFTGKFKCLERYKD
ncbi:MAG: hypothetical protein LWY06_13380 [Firmicutes bacterium]|nr:hypothetical protein [Bacillota bacterium]